MTLRQQYPKVVTELYKLNSYPRSQIIADVTCNQVTPEIELQVKRLCRISGVGRMTALELLFAIAINL